MIAYMRLCQKYQLHLLSDEIYALTTFPTADVPNPTPFTSLLSIDKTDVIDPSLCHVLHGMSKVVSSPKLRIGLLRQRIEIRGVDFSSKRSIDRGHAVNEVQTSFSTYNRLSTMPSSLASLAMSTILDHPTFLRNFFKTNCQGLRQNYTLCTRVLKAHSIQYFPSNAGLFLMIDLSPYLNNLSGDTSLGKERVLNLRLLDGGIHLTTSETLWGEDYGWFRLTFSIEPQTLTLGLTR
jgi:aspartate/methionine/tyrosine aminotransferase